MRYIFLIVLGILLLGFYWCEDELSEWAVQTQEGEEDEQQPEQETENEIQEENNDLVQVYYFWWDGCPACDAQNQHWEELEEDDYYQENININRFEVWANPENAQLMDEVWDHLWENFDAVPTTIIWEEPIVWVETQQIESRIDECIENECDDPVEEIINN